MLLKTWATCQRATSDDAVAKKKRGSLGGFNIIGELINAGPYLVAYIFKLL